MDRAGSDGRWRTGSETVFRKLFAKKPTPLTGAPPVRRMKTYSAQSGYVYQYFYEGRRGLEFVFSVSADRKQWNDVSVMVSETAIREWGQSHGRELTQTEQYAVAKMALFQAFDERENPAQFNSAIQVGITEMSAITGTLEL